MLTNEELLAKIKVERPEQDIHSVISFEMNDFGFYNVKVDMSVMFYGTRILHSHHIIPYPLSDYEKLSGREKLKWRSDTSW